MPCWTSTDPRATRQRTRRKHRLSAVAVATALVAGCTTSTPSTSANTARSEPVGTARSTPRTSPPANAEATTPADMPGADTPQAVAIHWLSAYRSAAWTDPRPAAWIDRVRPYVTDAMHAHNTTLRDGVAGTDWVTFVRLRCTSTVVDIAAIVPPESPGTATTANVHVSGSVRTNCAAGPAPVPTELAAVTLVVVTTSHGWRVDQRLF